MKIAISGKGGVGKTTVAACLADSFTKHGYSVLAVDADPDANLAAALGFPRSTEIVPLAKMKEVIEERTASKTGGVGTFFKLNPKVDDLPEKLWLKKGEIRLMVMGTVKKGGAGCICPESVFLKALVDHLILDRNEVVILDMEAGIEHLGRATARAVDKLIVVVEPGRRSVETAFKIRELGKDIGLDNIALVGNKIQNDKNREFLIRELPDFEFLGFIPYDDNIVEADLQNLPPFELSHQALEEIEKMVEKISSNIAARSTD